MGCLRGPRFVVGHLISLPHLADRFSIPRPSAWGRNRAIGSTVSRHEPSEGLSVLDDEGLLSSVLPQDSAVTPVSSHSPWQVEPVSLVGHTARVGFQPRLAERAAAPALDLRFSCSTSTASARDCSLRRQTSGVTKCEC